MSDINRKYGLYDNSLVYAEVGVTWKDVTTEKDDATCYNATCCGVFINATISEYEVEVAAHHKGSWLSLTIDNEYYDKEQLLIDILSTALTLLATGPIIVVPASTDSPSLIDPLF